MKKFYTLIAIAFANFSNAQTVDFESISLAPNSAYDGSDFSGTATVNANSTTYDSTFVLSGLEMANQWTVSGPYGYISKGWAFSNKTSDTTTGLSGAYNSYAGGGANGSDNYAVTFIGNNPEIKLENNALRTFGEISVTNNTYAAYSMINGDQAAKKFGGASGNDEDWFLLDIIGYDENGLVTDTIKFYLADYRFSDNSQDYIVKEWKTIDLSNLGEINKIKFELSSSDNGQWGMNTPSYLAVDNINFGYASITETSINKINVYPNPANSTIKINNETNNAVISIYTLAGQKVLHKNVNTVETTINVSELVNGIYVIMLNENGSISTTRLVKQ